MNKIICIVLALFLVTTSGCTKKQENKEVNDQIVSSNTSNKDNEKKDTKNIREKIIDNYWVVETNSGGKVYKNFTYKNVITLDPNGMDDLIVETVEGILENDDNSADVIGNLTDYNGSVEIEYKLESVNETDLNANYYFKNPEQSESDTTPEPMKLKPISLEEIKSDIKEFYKDKTYLQLILDSFEDKITESESNEPYNESSTQSLNISKEEAHKIAENHYENVGTPIAAHHFIVVDYVYNGKSGYTVEEDSGKADMAELYNMGVIFIDGDTGVVTVIEGPDESPSRGEEMLQYIDFDKMWE